MNFKKKIKGKILIIDHYLENLDFLDRILTEKGYEVNKVTNSKIALMIIKTEAPELILLNIVMPEIDAYQLCKQLKNNPKTASIPIIFMNSIDETIDKIKVFEVGGADYITKPFQVEEILVKIHHHLTLLQLQRQLEKQNQKLQQSQNDLLAITNNMSNGIIIADGRKKIIFLNAATEKLLGTSEEDLRGKQIKLNLQLKQQEIKIKHYSGKKLILKVKKQEIIWHNNLAYLIILINISKYKQNEMALFQAKKAAEAANFTKSSFLASMNHELRTPLNAILGFTQLIYNDPTLDIKKQEYIKIIHDSGKYLLSLINKILEMSKIEVGKLKVIEKNFDFYSLLSQLEEMFQEEAKSKGIELSFSGYTQALRYLKTDEEKLGQILVNLLNNAIKFTSEGKVSLTIKSKPNQEDNLSTKQKIIISFEIEDTGLGIEATEIDKIFKVFEKTIVAQNSQKGTGLGLAISKKYAEALGGDLTLTSTVGKGTIANLYLPVEIPFLKEISFCNNCSFTLKLPFNEKKNRILVIDHNKENSDLLLDSLTKVGFQVKVANNEIDGITLWESFMPNLVLIDILIPKMEVSKMIKRIRAKEKTSCTKIIAITVNGIEDDLTKNIKTEYDDLISKPWREEILLQKIAQHLQIEYIKVEKGVSDLSSSNTPLIELKPSDLEVMPTQWRMNLNHFAAAADCEEIAILLDKIPEKHEKLKEKLNFLLNNFLFETISDLTKNKF